MLEESSLLLLLAVVFLFPIAVYLTTLALLNRRLRPVVVSGAWDCVGLLFASSGLLLVAGPAIFSHAYHRFVEDAALEARGESDALPFDTIWAMWWGIWVLYYLLVVGGGALMLWWRSRKTVIYNVDPTVLERLLLQSFDKLGFETNRLGNRIFIGAGEVPAALQESVRPNALLPTATARRTEQAKLDLEVFPSLCNATLHWHTGSAGVRGEVEAELSRALADVHTFDNSAGTWLLGLAGLLFGLIFLTLVALVLIAVLPLRR